MSAAPATGGGTSGGTDGDSAVTLSIVVPTWGDAEDLAILFPKLERLRGPVEIIVVDASEEPAPAQIATANRTTYLRCATPNRGAQMNLGADRARGDIILFQHADTDLTDAHLDAVRLAMQNGEIVGGAFYRKFDNRHPRLMWLEKVARFLTRNGGTLFGDQSVFVRRDVFMRLKGFAKIPLMEDVEFSRRLRAAGRVVVLDPPVQTSARRHFREGAWRKSIQNGLIILLYKAGVSPERLHRWYYRKRAARTADSGSTRNERELLSYPDAR